MEPLVEPLGFSGYMESIFVIAPPIHVVCTLFRQCLYLNTLTFITSLVVSLIFFSSSCAFKFIKTLLNVNLILISFRY